MRKQFPLVSRATVEKFLREKKVFIFIPSGKAQARTVKDLAARVMGPININAEQFPKSGSPLRNRAKATFMPIAPKRGMHELCFSVLLSLTFGQSERVEKLICDSGDKTEEAEKCIF